jgi:hypothetical protein
MARTALELGLGSRRPRRRPGRTGRALGSALLWVFCLPFAAFGLFAANEGVNRLSTGGKQGGFMLAFGVIFAALPLALLLAARRGRKTMARKDERQARHPDAPWLWNEAWADGRIRCANRAGMLVAWIFAVAWNGLSWPLLSVLPREMERGNAAALLGLLFPLAGLGLLVWAVRATLRWRRFGASLFEMTSLPGVLGGELAGTLHTGAGLMGAREFLTRLACIRRYVTGSGRSRSTHEDIVWAEEERLAGCALTRSPHGLALPVRFAIPFDCRPSDPLDSNDRILWRLEVTAAVPGVDYHAQFEVPVFETRASDPARTVSALAMERGGAGDPPAGRAASGIVVRSHPAGGTEIVFPAGRQMGTALVTTFFAALFGGFTWVCRAQAAPIFFTIVFGAFTTLIAYGALRLWLGSTRVHVRRDGVRVEDRLLFLRSRKTVPTERIDAIDLEVGMRSGSRVYWDLRLRTKGGSRASGRRLRGTRIAGRIADRREAERLAAAIATELGR